MTDILYLLLICALFPPHCVMEIGENPEMSPTPSGSTSTKITSMVLRFSSFSTSYTVPSTVAPGSPKNSSSIPVPLPLGSNAQPALAQSRLHDSTINYRHRHFPNSYPRGPHFEETVVNVTVREYHNVHLDCRVGLIEDKLVSWVRRKTDQLELLTLGNTNHSTDPRFSTDFKYPNNWRLGIRNVSRNDSGTYLCQISTHPPKVFEVQLTVEAPEVFVISSRGERVQEVYYKEGSTLQLVCQVSNVKSRSINWYHNADLLNQDITRGGVSIKTEIVANHAKSILSLARITRRDIGTYLCSSPPQNASVTVHILNDENPAELYRNRGSIILCSHYYILVHFFVYFYAQASFLSWKETFITLE